MVEKIPTLICYKISSSESQEREAMSMFALDDNKPDPALDCTVIRDSRYANTIQVQIGKFDCRSKSRQER